MADNLWGEYVDLQPYNTFNVPCVARWLIRIRDPKNLHELRSSALFHQNRCLVLGGGSNVLFANAEYGGVILKNEIQGIETKTEDEKNTVLRVGGGVEWGSLVDYCIQRDLGGLENLSLIPGTVGAASIQNIGAYGAELSDVLLDVEVFDLDTGEMRTMSKEECELGYRDSIFKRELRDVMVCFITIRVTKEPFHQLSTGYASIQDMLLERGTLPTIRSVGEAVCILRRKKLPDPKNLGNAGSFFKNVVCDESGYRRIAAVEASAPFHRKPDGRFVVPAAWLIERCGWKGRRFDRVGVSTDHALVLVNLNRAQGGEIVWLADLIIRDVQARLGVMLTPEVNIIR